jgi:integrase
MGLYKPKKDPKNWWIDYRVPLGEGRYQRVRKKIGADKRKAESALTRIKGQIAAGTYFEIRRPKLTFDQLADRYFENPKSPHKRTLYTDKGRAEPLRAYFGKTLVETITAADVKRYQRHREGMVSERTGHPLRPGTINREVATLSLIFNTGLLHGDVEENPCKGVPKLPEDNIRHHSLGHEEYLRLLNALPSSDRSGPWRAFIATCYHTGMRRSEVLRLTWDRVDLENDVFLLERQHTKTKEPRKVPISTELKALLALLPKDTPSFRVFTFQGKPWKAAGDRVWKAALKKAKLDPTLWKHDLRHQFVTDALDAHVPEPFIMEMTGHKTRSVFDRYADPTVDHLRKGMAQIAAHRGNKAVSQAVNPPVSTQSVGTMWTPDPARSKNDEGRSAETALENSTL